VANLGGTLRPVVQPGLYGSSTIYSGVLTFASSTGRFDSVTSPSLFLNASAVYNPTSVDLVLTRVPFNQLPGGGANARAVGNVLEANYSTSLTGALAGFYTSSCSRRRPTRFPSSPARSRRRRRTRPTPCSASSSAPSSARPEARGRWAAAAAGGARQPRRPRNARRRRAAARAWRSAPPNPASAMPATTVAARRYTFWAQGFGGSSSIDGNANIGNSRVDMTSAAAYRASTRGSSQCPGRLHHGHHQRRLQPHRPFELGRRAFHRVRPLWRLHAGPAYVDAALAYGYSTFTSNRFIGTGTLSEIANASFDGSQYGGRVEAAGAWASTGNVLTPFAGLTVQALTQSAYSENSRTAATGAPGVLGVGVQANHHLGALDARRAVRDRLHRQ
jgi:hypothetical protein